MDFEMKYGIGFGFEKQKSVHLCLPAVEMSTDQDWIGVGQD